MDFLRAQSHSKLNAALKANDLTEIRACLEQAKANRALLDDALVTCSRL